MSVKVKAEWIEAVEDLIRARDFAGALKRIEDVQSEVTAGCRTTDHLLYVMAAECLAFLGDYERAIRLANTVVVETRKGPNHRLFARSCFVVAVASYYRGDIESALESINLSLFTYKRVEDEPCIARGLNWLGNIVFYKSDYLHALQAYEECARLSAQHSGMTRMHAIALGNIALVQTLRGNVKDAQTHLEAIATILGDSIEILSRLRHKLGWVLLHMSARRYDDASAQLEAVFPDLDDHAGRREHGIWYEYSGELAFCQGHYDDAIKHLNTAIDIANESGPDESLIGQSRRVLAQTYLAQGEVDLAMAECKHALVSIRKVGERYEEGVVDRVIGQIHSARGDADSTREAFARSADILRLIGANLELARTGLAAGQSTLLAERERVAYLLEAERIFAQVGVEYWSRETDKTIRHLAPDDPTPPQRVAGGPSSNCHSAEFLTVHEPTRQMIEIGKMFSKDAQPILITGETGTGKDLLARRLHETGPRRSKPFVVIDPNCISETIWESELFGHRKGAFTGAERDRIGLLESADGGTVLLNEIGELPLNLQVKLLSFLDRHILRRVGENEDRTIDVHVIAATNKNLERAVENNEFRQDLYHRLANGRLKLCPLRDRPADIPVLLRHFLKEIGVAEAILDVVLGQVWVDRARRFHWPGNVRELRAFATYLGSTEDHGKIGEWIHRADQILDYFDRRERFADVQPDGELDTESESVGPPKRQDLIDLLERNDWNQRAAAREHGVAESTLRAWMNRQAVNRSNGDELDNLLAGQ